MGGDILQELYDSEINACIQTFWDGGFQWKLGDDLIGWGVMGNAETYREAAEQLRKAALEHYPDSDFARRNSGRLIARTG